MTATTVDQEIYDLYPYISAPSYEGASLAYQAERYNLHNGEHAQLAARELATLRMRSEDLVRNNAYARTALNKYKTSLSSINVNWKDATGKKHQAMQDVWDEFAANPNLDGYGTLANTQSIWHSSIFLSGASYTQMLIKREGNSNKVPIKLKGIPSSLHDITFTGVGLADTSKVTNYGITFRDSKPETYYFTKSTLEQNLLNPSKIMPVAVPADELIHIFFRDQPGQWIGIPSLAPVLIPLYELDELTDATIAKQKVAQAIAWIIENSNTVARTPTGSPINVKDEAGNDKIVFKSKGGHTQYLNKGEKINFFEATDIGANLPVLIKAELHRIASVLDVPYHSLTGDTDGLDFSSIRAIGIELRNRLEYIHHFYTIPLGLAPLTAYFKKVASLYDRRVVTAIPNYQLPRWYGVDELKDTQADLLEVQNGMATLQSKLDERHTTYEEIVADMEKRKELGIELVQTNQSLASQGNNTQANSNSTGN